MQTAASPTDLAGSNSSLPPRSSTAPLPAELEALLGPLAQARSVLGLLVLAREGSAAAAATVTTATHAPVPAEATSSEGSDNRPAAGQQERANVFSTHGPTIVQTLGAPFEGDQGRAYALRVADMVEAVEQGCIGKDGSGDPLKFLRIRTTKHELIITPDPNYVLVVLHDPAQ